MPVMGVQHSRNNQKTNTHSHTTPPPSQTTHTTPPSDLQPPTTATHRSATGTSTTPRPHKHEGPGRSRARRSTPQTRSHPRIGGEQLHTPLGLGPSPLTRGATTHTPKPGAIPAPAGRSSSETSAPMLFGWYTPASAGSNRPHARRRTHYGTTDRHRGSTPSNTAAAEPAPAGDATQKIQPSPTLPRTTA